MRPATRTAGAIAEPAARLINTVTSDQTLTIIGWHRFGEAADGLTTRLDDFRAQVDELDAWGATVLPLRTAVDLLRRGELPEKAVVLTFDDGYASSVEQAWPILRERALPATLFVVSGYLDGTRPFPWDIASGAPDELARLATTSQVVEAAAAGLAIGSHTANHPWLPKLSLGEVASELLCSRVELEDLLGTPVDAFAYPMGGWNPTIRDLTEQSGYDIAVTVDRGVNAQRRDPLALRRAFAFDRAEDFRRQLRGAYTWMRPIENRRRKKEPQW